VTLQCLQSISFCSLALTPDPLKLIMISDEFSNQYRRYSCECVKLRFWALRYMQDMFALIFLLSAKVEFEIKDRSIYF
jgi:hypothetical protein